MQRLIKNCLKSIKDHLFINAIVGRMEKKILNFARMKNRQEISRFPKLFLKLSLSLLSILSLNGRFYALVHG